MTGFLIFATFIGGACWALKQWLAFYERQQFMKRVTERQEATGQVIDITEAQQLYAASRPSLPHANAAKTAGMNKWMVMGLCALYIVCPIDFIPDFIPVLGWGDDVAAAVIGLRAMFR